MSLQKRTGDLVSHSTTVGISPMRPLEEILVCNQPIRVELLVKSVFL